MTTQISLPETLAFGLRGHSVSVAVADMNETELTAYLVYGAQRMYNDRIGAADFAGKGFKAASPEAIAQVEAWFAAQREQVRSGVSGRSGPRTRKPVEPVAAAREAILDERLAAYISANLTALLAKHNVSNVTALRKEKIDALYRAKIAEKYAAEIETEAKARAAKLAKATTVAADAGGDTLDV